jgi:DNA repair protein RecO (recombination protein O)
MQGLYRDQGIVLRGIRLGEADRILSVLMQSHGRVRMVAKGVRKMKSRFGGRLDAFTHVDLLLYKGRDLDVITQAEIVGRFPRLREDYAAFTAASAMADTVERTTPERERNVRLFVLLRNGLGALEAGARDPSLLAHAFLAKATSMYGAHPSLESCVGCGAPERVALSFASGGAVCRTCVERADPQASPAALSAWARLLDEDWEWLREATLDAPVHRQLAGLLVGFAQWQLDSRFRSFGLLKPEQAQTTP